MKKLLLTLLIICTFILCGCSETNPNLVTLPNLEGMTREEMKVALYDAKVKYVFKFDQEKIIEDEDDLDKFVSYHGAFKAGDRINSNYLIYVYTTVLPLTYRVSDTVKITFDYEGKSFINDGCGKVTLVRATDGDTATFYDPIARMEFRLRFLGIDTPESTILKDPWGKAASNYTKEMLTNAKEIVLESQKDKATTETYGRYLGFVWVDGKLLNLLLIEEAYTNSTLNGYTYDDIFRETAAFAKATGRRFYGEKDPGYDYVTKQFK